VDVQSYRFSHDAHSFLNWTQGSMDAASTQDLQQVVVALPTPFDDGEPNKRFLSPDGEPLQSYGERGSNPLDSPSDISVLGIAGLTMHENFPSYVTESTIVGSEVNAHDWENPDTCGDFSGIQ
jgi:membrane-associated protease RseP (regulator of RpoE activity)